jgi:hypothetical protein
VSSRCTASGVRSSCEAFVANRRWPSYHAATRSNASSGASPSFFSGSPVQPDPGALQHRRQGGPRAAAQRPDPGDQFRERERLGQVVVRAEIQTVHPVPDPGRRGEHHPDLPARRHDPPAHFVAMHPRQITVQDHHVAAVHHHPLRRLSRLFRIGDMIDQ